MKHYLPTVLIADVKAIIPKHVAVARIRIRKGKGAMFGSIKVPKQVWTMRSKLRMNLVLMKVRRYLMLMKSQSIQVARNLVRLKSQLR